MECRECGSYIHDFMRAEMASGEMRTKVFDHIEHCAHCEAHFYNIRSLERALRALAENTDTERSAAEMESVLRTLFQQQKRVRRHSRSVASWVAVGVVASLLLSMGVLSWRRLIAPEPTPPAVALPQLSPPATASKAQAPGPAAKGAPQNGRHRKSKPDIPAQPADGKEFVTGFYALPYAENSNRAFSGEIVRVKLRGSALPAIGFPVALNGDQAAEQITADLFVGQNGLPLAIRFVR